MWMCKLKREPYFTHFANVLTIVAIFLVSRDEDGCHDRNYSFNIQKSNLSFYKYFCISDALVTKFCRCGPVYLLTQNCTDMHVQLKLRVCPRCVCCLC